MGEIQPGSVVSIASDIVANGNVTFSRGEQVTIMNVAPSPESPDYKYVVYSAKAGTYFTLRDLDFMPSYQPPPAPAAPAAQYQPPPQPRYQPPAQPQYQAPPPQPRNAGALKGCLIAFGAVAVVGAILAVVLFVVVGVGIRHVVKEVEKTTANGVTLPGGITLSNKVPTEAQLGIPVYPGSKMSASSVSIKNASGNISASVLYTDDDPATVVAWYKARLSGKPDYQSVGDSATDAMITFKNDNGATVVLTIGRDQYDKSGKTTIAVGSSNGGTAPGGN